MSGLWPREHGAYAQLGFPLLTGLVYAHGHPGAFALAAAAVSGFLAHEPVAVLAGVRGSRLQDQLRRPARRRLLLLASLAAAALVAAAVLVPARAWLAALVPAGLGLLLLPALGTRRMKTMTFEVIAVAVFSATVLPLALCGPTSPWQAGIAAAVWFGAFAPAVFAVHAIKAALRKRPEERWLLRAAPAVAVAAMLAAALGAWRLPRAHELLIVLLPATVILALGLRPPHPRQLKRVGWALVATNTVVLVLLVTL